MNSEKSFYFIVVCVFLFLTLVTILRINLYPPQLVLSQAIPMESVLPMQQQLGLLSPVVNVNGSNFQSKAINPVLVKLNLYSPASSNLLLGTAIQETMVGKLSKNIFQISLDTAKDVNNYYLAKNPELKSAVSHFYNAQESLAWNLENNVAYEIAMARMIYLMKTDKPIPGATDYNALGKFWKVNYNTYLGKGTAKEYAVHYEEYEKSQQMATQYPA
jgi:hypothetical protein